MKLEFLDLAQGDLIDGYRFYESQEVGLGSNSFAHQDLWEGG